MKKIQNIQALRGVAVLSVLLFHLVAIEEKYGGSATILPKEFAFGMFGVDLFFVISGFIMVTVTRSQVQNTKQAFRFLYHRVSRIYPIYWVYTLLVLCVYLIKEAQGTNEVYIDILASFLLYPSGTPLLVAVGWTLVHEMYFYLIFFFSLLLTSERYMPALIFIWGVAVIFLNASLESSNHFLKLVSHPLTLDFIGGYFLAKWLYRPSDGIIKTRTLMILAAIGLIISMFAYKYYFGITGQIQPSGWWRVMIFGIPSMLIVFCFFKAERNGYIIHSSLVNIGNASYSIYLTHILTLIVIGKVWNKFSSDALYDNLLMLPALFLTAIIVGTISYNFIEKPLLIFSRKIA